MTNNEIIEEAMKQSAIDLNCNKDDFTFKENKVVSSVKNEKARKYLSLPFDCTFVYYGNNIVASVGDDIKGGIKALIDKDDPYNCFEVLNVYALNDLLKEYKLKICFMAEYFLPDMKVLKPLDCKYEMRLLDNKDFKDLYTDEWSNALCFERKELDVIGIGAYDNGKLIGLAGASADCENMWQIGIDVLKEYRKMGIAAALTSNLAVEILKKGKIPFYCASWSNLKSVKNAIKSGFRPAWIEMHARKIEIIKKY